MNQESKNALQLLTGKPDLAGVSVDELQQLAESYPYFAAAHLLLLEKMQQVQAPGLQNQAYKTALFFPDEQWLYYVLSGKNNEKTSDAPIDITQPEAVSESIGLIPAQLVPETLPDEDDTISAEIKKEDIHPVLEDANLVTLPAEHILENISDLNDITSEPEEFPLDEEELRQQSEPLPMEESNQKIANLLSGQAVEFSKPVEPTTEIPVATEPFHTVDYFASQGIRLDGKREENALDRKVHKFTDWLRQMKRINPHPVDLGTEEEEETFIANIADSSNHTKEILTESMAEVLVKQGKSEQALEIYQKIKLVQSRQNNLFCRLNSKNKIAAMPLVFFILIVIVCIALAFFVLVQNPKGGGLSGSFGGLNNQIMGVKQTTDVLEKGTWVFASALGVLCIISVLFFSNAAGTKR